MNRRDALKLLGFTSFAFLTGCKEISVDITSGNEESLAYSRIRAEENARVWKLLEYYAKGNTLDETSAYERLNIAFMTDSHIDLGPAPVESRRNVKDAIDFCNLSPVPIAAILQGGDLVTQIKATKKEHIKQLNDYFDMGWKARMPLLFTKGNHDLNAINVSPDQLMKDQDWGEVWYDRAEKKYGIVRQAKSNGQKSSYYYYDLKEWKVRIISVDCFDVDYSKTDKQGNILYWGGTSNYIGNKQFNWIADSALNFDDKDENDWGVIVFMHFYRPSDKDGTSIEPKFESIYKRLNSMLLAFNNQQSYTEEYMFPPNPFYNLSINASWIRYAGLEKKPYLIGVLSGHQHTDIYMNWWGAQHLVTANQFCGKEFSDERIERKVGTKSQDLFDIINIDLKERRMRVIRYGASANLDGLEGNRFLPDGLGF